MWTKEASFNGYVEALEKLAANPHKAKYKADKKALKKEDRKGRREAYSWKNLTPAQRGQRVGGAIGAGLSMGSPIGLLAGVGIGHGIGKIREHASAKAHARIEPALKKQEQWKIHHIKMKGALRKLKANYKHQKHAEWQIEALEKVAVKKSKAPFRAAKGAVRSEGVLANVLYALKGVGAMGYLSARGLAVGHKPLTGIFNETGNPTKGLLGEGAKLSPKAGKLVALLRKMH